MLYYIRQKLKNITLSLQFSILLIFVTLFMIAMLSLIGLMYYRFTQSMSFTAFSLMEKVSSSAFDQIINEMKNAEVKSESLAQLITLGIVDPRNELVGYTSNMMAHETALFPSVQSVFWGDTAGNFVMAEKEPDNSVLSEIIERTTIPPTRKLIYRDSDGNIIRTLYSPDLTYDPRIRPWFHAGEMAKQTTWLDVYPYRLTGFLGISVVTPVYKINNQLLGVVNLNIRLDYLQHLIENVTPSSNGLVFIVSRDEKLIAFPQLEQYRNMSLINIHTLPIDPWIIASFDEFKKTGQEKFTFYYKEKEYLATYLPVSTFGSHSWLIGAVVPADDFIGPLRKTYFITIAFSLVMLIVSILLVSLLINRVVKPLKRITREIQTIKNFKLKGNRIIRSRIKEINFMAQALNSMKKSLRTFQRYVPASLVRQLIETGEDARIGGVKKPLTVLFSDIQNFTTIAEKMDPDLLMQHLCEYFDALSHIIVANRGTIDKYIGDSIMAFWGAPLPEVEPAKKAAMTALLCIQQVAILNEKWKLAGKPQFFTRFGIHSGEAIVGNLGSSERLNYTVIGDIPNTSSRLENMNKMYNTQIIVSDAIYHIIKNHFILRLLDYVLLRGKAKASYIYELIAIKGQPLTYDVNAYSAEFNRAFSAYQKMQWDDASVLFSNCLLIYPSDSVALLFISRCEKFKLNPPSKDWIGIWVARDK